MSATDTPPFDEQFVVERHRLALAAAVERRRLRKEHINETWRDELAGADIEFAQVIARARADDVSWLVVERCTGLSRQALSTLERSLEQR